MKKYLSALATGAALLTLLAPVAQAETTACVSKGEYSHVHRGMTMTRVHRLFDTSGQLDIHIGHISVRKYRPCPRHSAVSVSYRRGRVSAKVAFWHAG